MSSTGIALPRSLRPNRNIHPGAADKPCAKQTTQEVQAEKDAREAALASTEASRAKTIAATAALEEKMRQEQEEKLQNASNPPLTSTRKVLRPRSTATTPQGK